MNKIDENELKQIFRDLKNNKESGYYILYNKYGKIIYSVSFSILKNKEDSNNITQNIIANLMNFKKDDFPTFKEASWIYTYIKKETLLYLKKKRGYVNYDTLYEIEKNNHELENIIEKEKYNSLIKRVSENNKEIISLKILSNLSYSQIAKFLNKTELEIKLRYGIIMNFRIYI